MKNACIATILAILLSFSVSGIAKAADNNQPAETKKPTKFIAPHPVTMEEWTDIVRSLRKVKERPDAMPDKPFRFRLKQNPNNLVEL